MTHDPAVTLYLARFFSLGCLLLCLAMVARPDKSLSAIASIMESEGLVFSLGIFTMAAGVATLVGHNVWVGPLAVFVSLMGWLMTIKGLMLMALNKDELRRIYGGIGYPRRIFPVMLIAAALCAVIAVLAYWPG